MALGSYLSIPWHLYSEMPYDHAYMACQRLILVRLVSDNDALDVELHTEQPRITTALDGSARRWSDTGNARPAFIAASVTQAAPNVDGAVSAENIDMLEEAAYDEYAEADSATQPALYGEAHAPVSTVDEMIGPKGDDMGPVAGWQSRRHEQASDHHVYRHDVHLDLWRPHALRLMVCKDNELWFGSGRRKD